MNELLAGERGEWLKLQRYDPSNTYVHDTVAYIRVDEVIGVHISEFYSVDDEGESRKESTYCTSVTTERYVVDVIQSVEQVFVAIDDSRRIELSLE